MQINDLKAAASSQPAAPTTGTGYPSQSTAYQLSGVAVPATDDNGYPPQPAEYQPFVPPAPVPAATDNSARIAELTAEMQACATNDDFTRAMELQEEVGHFLWLFFLVLNTVCSLQSVYDWPTYADQQAQGCCSTGPRSDNRQQRC